MSVYTSVVIHVNCHKINTVAVFVMSLELVPGALVRHPAQPDWGIGQVQSVIGDRVTVNFEHQGKHLINNAVVQLVVVVPNDDKDAETW